MEKAKRRNKKLSLINIFFILALCILACLSALIYKKYRFLNKQNQDLSIKLDQTEKQLESFSNEVNEYKSKLDEAKNSLEKVEDKKDEYYTNIRKLEDKILKGESDKKIAYITIDDGPYDKTYDFLKLLKEYNGVATFFVLLKPAREQTYRDILAGGNSLGNHTASHKLGKNGIYTSPETFLNDFYRLQNYLTDTIGYSPTLYRFPGGSPTAGKFKVSIASKLKEDGFSYVDWNVIVGDGSDALLKQKRPYEWFREQISDKKIALILMHDYSTPTLEDFPKMLQYLKDNNYLILPLSNKSVMVN